jgi:hypothetical protein
MHEHLVLMLNLVEVRDKTWIQRAVVILQVIHQHLRVLLEEMHELYSIVISFGAALLMYLFHQLLWYLYNIVLNSPL